LLFGQAVARKVVKKFENSGFDFKSIPKFIVRGLRKHLNKERANIGLRITPLFRNEFNFPREYYGDVRICEHPSLGGCFFFFL